MGSVLSTNGGTSLCWCTEHLAVVTYLKRPTVKISPSRAAWDTSLMYSSISHKDIGIAIQLSLHRHVQNERVRGVWGGVGYCSEFDTIFSHSLPSFVLTPPPDSVLDRFVAAQLDSSPLN